MSLRRSRSAGTKRVTTFKSEVEILAEGPVLVGGFQIAVRGGDDAHVDLHALIAADGTHFFFLQHSQQLGLQFQGKFANFIKEDGAAISRLKQSLLGFQRAGEGSLFVAEEFAFDERGHQRSAVNRHEGREANAPRKCMARATSSFPVPLSP